MYARRFPIRSDSAQAYTAPVTRPSRPRLGTVRLRVRPSHLTGPGQLAAARTGTASGTHEDVGTLTIDIGDMERHCLASRSRISSSVGDSAATRAGDAENSMNPAAGGGAIPSCRSVASVPTLRCLVRSTDAVELANDFLTARSLEWGTPTQISFDGTRFRLVYETPAGQAERSLLVDCRTTEVQFFGP